MDKEITLKTLIEGGRDIKNFSQRELARRIGLSNTSLNDLENGKVQKPDIEVLRKIAEELDLSLEQLLKAAGYNAITTMLTSDEFQNKSTRDLKNIIKECRNFKYDILDWDSNKRNITRNVMADLERITHKLELIRDNRGINYTLDNAIEDINKSLEELKEIYDDLSVSKNELGEDEISFNSLDKAVNFTHAALLNSKVYASDIDRFSMQYLADLLKLAVDKKVININDLYSIESEVIIKLEKDSQLKAMWDEFRSFSQVLTNKTKPDKGYWVNIPAKRRYINPYVISQGRVATLSSECAKDIEEFLNVDFNIWLSGK